VSKMRRPEESFSSYDILQKEAELKSMIKNAIHKNIITQPEYEKIMMLSEQDLMIEISEKRLLDHVQGLMGDRPCK
jgi:hypothetical protein